MPKSPRRTRIFAAPYPEELFDAWIDDITEEPGETGVDIVFTLRSLRLLAPMEPRLVEGELREVGCGEYHPMRLRFTRAEWLARAGVYEHFAELPPEHEARHLFSVLHSRQPGAGEFFWITTGGIVEGELTLRAQGYTLEAIASEKHEAPAQVEVTRRYALTPSAPTGILPHRPALYRRYGGDPITIHLGRRTLNNRFFVGGLHHQRERRPHIDYVLNLCGVQNPWCALIGVHPNDRFVYKGEMAIGMDATELLEEARWVVERLRAGKRVLVHCYAGVNRSTTVCCAALMLLEGLSAEEALARVREHHPIAWPDPYHWFMLRWLSRLSAELDQAHEATEPEVMNTDTASGEASEAEATEEPEHEAPLLRETSKVG